MRDLPTELTVAALTVMALVAAVLLGTYATVRAVEHRRRTTHRRAAPGPTLRSRTYALRPVVLTGGGVLGAGLLQLWPLVVVFAVAHLVAWLAPGYHRVTGQLDDVVIELRRPDEWPYDAPTQPRPEPLWLVQGDDDGGATR